MVLTGPYLVLFGGCVSGVVVQSCSGYDYVSGVGCD